MFVSNKTYKKLQNKLDKLEADHLDRIAAKNKRIEDLEAQVDYWQHLLTSSPEIKADTEAAFKRGMQHARNQLKNFLMKHFLSDSEPVTEIPSRITISKPSITIENNDQEQ